MANAARAFDEQRGGNIFRGLAARNDATNTNHLPWVRLQEGELPPMMFQLRLRDGRMLSYPYSDIREVRSRDAGRVEVYLLGLDRLVITFEGRHLRELANLLSRATVLWVDEADHRDAGKPESVPEVVSITVEQAGD